MTQKERALLRDAFAAPAPVRKEAFLRQLPPPPMNCFALLLTQLAYFRKRSWGFAAVLLALAWIGANRLDGELLWCLSAFTPPLALIAVTECGRSESFGMAELECATRFSLKSVVLARLAILGASNLLFLCLLVLLVFPGAVGTLAQVVFCMLCPYLLTVSLGLRVTRSFRGKESAALCIGIGAGISVACIVLPRLAPALYHRQNELVWGAAFVLLLIGAARQCIQIVRQKEELTWSL